MLVDPKILKTLQQADAEPVHVTKSGTGTQALLSQALLNKGENVVLVVPDQNHLDELRNLLGLFSGTRPGAPFWEREWVFFPAFSAKRPRAADWSQRMAALFTLHESSQPMGIGLTLDNLLPFWPPLKVLNQDYLFLIRGETFAPEDILNTTIAWGYERVSMVTRPGEISIRGDIFDIFPPGYEHPLRLEFFGDTLENLRSFTVLNQRSIKTLQETILLPVSPIIHEPGWQKEALEHWNHLWTIGALDKQTRAALEQQLSEGECVCWPGMYYPDSVPLHDWLPGDARYFLFNADQIRSKLEESLQDWRALLASERQNHTLHWPEASVIQSVARARQTWIGKKQVHFAQLPLGDRSAALALQEKQHRSFQDLFWKPEQKKRPWQTLVQHLKEWERTKRQTILAFHNARSREKFLQLLADEDITIALDYRPEHSGLYALIGSLQQGHELSWNQMLLLSDRVLQPQQDTRAAREAQQKYKGLQRLEEIAPDDLLIHRDYGLGRFTGMTRLQLNNVRNDYLMIDYAGGDKLYVPVDQLKRVQRYKGGENAVPALDRLGGVKWTNTKKRVQKALETIAHDLVEMYASRKLSKGYAYDTDTEFLKDFEASFAFEETVDQEKAIADVLQDMDTPEPMDRLVCGDAGFGKTEVAMRAAFKAVASGKQVALLCPTTVLAEQHFQNFKLRMEDFSINVAMLSRFVSGARQKEVLAEARKGMVDILIGTHRLLSKDVELPNLGLFILDEEQRFGVRHKERLKTLRKNIDVLTLTATPIPRTLQLSLSGIRQLSVIESPPRERKEVQTSIIDRRPEQLRNILERELQRSGQVFWVFNKVRGLERVKEFVQELAPGARVGMAHGQMSEKILEETMHRFLQGDLDILVSTSIVESGLDFPRANTLIVDQAQMFGLGQLYQLRGRVGRSKDQAHAYFVVPDTDKLGESARKRLQTILDLDFWGAGFQVAMEDLRLRGAGNILGEVQSGNINKVGLDLFLEMLEKEVRKLQGKPEPVESDPELQISFEANIPPEYVPDSNQRLSFYKALSAAGSRARLQRWHEEFSDRFGPPPEAVVNLFAVFGFKQEAARLGVDKAELYHNRVIVHWSEDRPSPVSPEKFVDWLQVHQKNATFSPPAKLELRFADKTRIAESLEQVSQSLREL